MKFRFTPIVRRFSKFANEVIRDFIAKARSHKPLVKNFNNLVTGYDYAVAYISYFNTLKNRRVLFKKEYTVNFGFKKDNIIVAFEKQDGSNTRGDFSALGITDDYKLQVPLIRILMEEFTCKKRGFLRKRFNVIEEIRRCIVHEVSHMYQFIKYEAFVNDELYVCPNKRSDTYALESFLYMFQGEELEAIVYEALHKWNICKHAKRFIDVFVTVLSEQLTYIEAKEYTSYEFFKAVSESSLPDNEIIVNYIFKTFLPASRFSKFFEDIPGLELIGDFDGNKIVSRLLYAYREILDDIPQYKPFKGNFKTIEKFNNLLELMKTGQIKDLDVL